MGKIYTVEYKNDGVWITFDLYPSLQYAKLDAKELQYDNPNVRIVVYKQEKIIQLTKVKQ